MANQKTSEPETIADPVSEGLIWHTETRKIRDLKEHVKNPRKITKEQMEKLKQSLKSFNYVETIVIN